MRFVRASFAILLLGLIGITYAPTAHAVSLKVAPLQYKAELKKGEQKKGSIDISNPSGKKLLVTTSVQAFRQIDDDGSLEFYKDEALQKGVKLDLKSFELGPREALRMYFLLDGKTLPTGDVYGAIFFTVKEDGAKASVQQNVRVGTLLSVVNGTPGPREAEIASLSAPLLQLGSEVKAKYTIRNPADPDTNTGFYPEVSAKLWPDDKVLEQPSRLLFAGRTRENSIAFKDVGFGIKQIEVSYGDSSRKVWVLVVEPFVLIVTGVILVAIIVEGSLWLRRRKKRSKF